MSTVSIIGSGGMAAATGGLAAKTGPHRRGDESRRRWRWSGSLERAPCQGHHPPLDVFLAGDDVSAKARVSAFVESLGLRPFDVGQLPMARTLEHVCPLSLGLMTHSVKHTNFAIGLTLLG